MIDYRRIHLISAPILSNKPGPPHFRDTLARIMNTKPLEFWELVA